MAISDPGGILATPLAVLERKGPGGGVTAIVDIIKDRGVGLVVVGLPRAMNGSIGGQAEKVRDFVNGLSGETGVPIEFRDERLSTVSAKRVLKEAVTKKARRKVRDDDVAAAIILQGYLDEERR